MTIFSINSGCFADVTVTGVVSASTLKGDGSQITSVSYENIASKPTLVSSSAQVTALLPGGTFSSSAQVQLNSVTGTTFGMDNFRFPQSVTASNLLVTDVASVRTLQTLYVTSSVIYESGSTKFGDSADDIHQFTGSIQLSQGAFMNPSTLTANITIPAGYNGLLVGPITNQETITVEQTATLTIV
jgi:hypothetical protein